MGQGGDPNARPVCLEVVEIFGLGLGAGEGAFISRPVISLEAIPPEIPRELRLPPPPPVTGMALEEIIGLPASTAPAMEARQIVADALYGHLFPRGR